MMFAFPQSLSTWLLFLGLLVTALIIRTCWVLIGIRRIQQSDSDGRNIVITSKRRPSKQRNKPIKTLVVLGSGGHTTEMLHLLKNINPSFYTPLIYVVATTDSTSLRRLKAFQKGPP